MMETERQLDCPKSLLLNPLRTVAAMIVMMRARERTVSNGRDWNITVSYSPLPTSHMESKYCIRASH